MEWLTNPETWIALVTLSALEIVLGVDNIIFISVLASKLPKAQQARARRVGLLGAMMHPHPAALLARLAGASDRAALHDTREGLLGPGPDPARRRALPPREGHLGDSRQPRGREPRIEGASRVTSFASLITQIMLLDIVFSLDSVITAIGMARQVGVMVAAVVIAVGVMLWASGPIAAFVDRHPTIKILALSFLLLIGFSLVAEGFDQHIPKGYIYFAMGVLGLRRDAEPAGAGADRARPAAAADAGLNGGSRELDPDRAVGLA